MNLNRLLLAALVAASMTASSIATAALGGTPNVSKEDLEKQWNGKQGPQSTLVAGVLLHWTADVCGKLNGQVSDVTQCQPKTESTSDKPDTP
ncbi:hypothetical protein PO80_24260 [Vibrio parahaemolyticus]|uniref:hypothetical protein n=1 Tax=Vibrio parahaemolyticus TaxID=670 RepID=UPI000541DD55|nr:hypothetical protein [Vibrio parahaemolyticus]KHF12157.1 hypothetical protein PO80_24260 [Vibrio parahaemolyticus]MCR9727202.1 hypothetical protein [Vibrio parahaemolyticus]MCR9742657.1 hypothetical protein [Vibrio parahaemolyticus]MCX4128949.1 hypothetical protein [Vibrio parahaemolyticus]OTV99217.1 hypothetical protein BA739_20950 [Vibrio parahaemolyticus]